MKGTIACQEISGRVQVRKRCARRDIRDFRQATAASFNAMRSDLTDLQAEMRTGFT